MADEYFIRKSGVDYNINSFSFTKELERSIDTCDVSIAKTSVSNFSIGDEVSVGTNDGGFVTLFAGRISDKQENLDGRVIIESFGAIINHVSSEEIYDNKSPEFIAEDLINTYTDLTYASTATSGVVITRFVSNTEKLSDNFKMLLELLSDWQIRSDNDKNFFFEPKDTTNSSEIIIIDTDAFLTSAWNRNPDKIVNKVTLVGDVQTFSTDQDGFTASGGETTTTLSFKPKGNVLITKNGTELSGGVEDGTTSPDFTVDRDNAIISYTVSLTALDAITIFYEYEIPVKVTAQNDASVATYGERSTKVENKNIRTMNDARTWVQNYLSVNSVEDVSGGFFVDINRNINVGELLHVTHTFNNINQTLLVTSTTIKYPDGIKDITVGRQTFDSLSQQKETNDRLKKLEQQFDNSDLLQLYREIIEEVNIDINQTYKAYTREIDNSWIVGTSTNAIVGTWTGTSGGGQLVVGPTNNTKVTTSVTSTNNAFLELFDSEYFKDNLSTATWGTSGEVTFTSGQVALSDVIAFESSAIITALPSVTFNNGSVLIELSNDNGDSWNTIDNDTELTFPVLDFDTPRFLLQEDNDKILLESGDGILLEPLQKKMKFRLTEDDASTADIASIKITYI